MNILENSSSFNKFFNDGKSDDFAKVIKKTDDLFKSVVFKPNNRVMSTERNNSENIIQDVLQLNQSNIENKDKKKEEDSNNNNLNDSIEKLFGDFKLPAEKIKNFKLIDDLEESLPLIENIIKIYSDNILMIDGIKQNFLFFKKTELGEISEESKEYLITAKEISDYFDFKHKLKSNMLPSLLKYGKFYAEVVNIEDVKMKYDNLITESRNIDNISIKKSMNYQHILYLLTEGDRNLNNYENDTLTDIFLTFDNVSEERNAVESNELKNLFEDYDFYDETDNSMYDKYFEENKGNTKDTDLIEKKKNNKKYNSGLSKVLLRYHNPHNIIELNLKDENLILGYVEINLIDSPDNTRYHGDSIINIIHRLGDSLRKKDKANYYGQNNQLDVSLKNLTKVILKKIIDQYKIKVSSHYGKEVFNFSTHIETELQKNIQPELLNNLKKIILATDKNDQFFKKMNIRFIFPNNMVKYDFGKSIIKKLIYPGKIYLLTELSNAMIKLTRSPLLRHFKIERGLRTNYRKLINTVRNEVSNLTTSVNDIFNTGTISKHITDFRDMYTIVDNGKDLVSTEIKALGDPNVKMNDLEFYLRDLARLSGIPSQMLNISDNSGDLREHLVYTNINFATQIINYQEVLNACNNKLFSRIFEILNDGKKTEMKEYINISLQPPTVLILQVIEGTLTSIQQIYQTFQSAGHPMSFEHLVKTLCPFLDYDKLKSSGTIEDLKKAAKAASGSENVY